MTPTGLATGPAADLRAAPGPVVPPAPARHEAVRPAAPPPREAARPSPRLWLLAAFAATLPFWDLGHPAWEVDDARYAEVPRAMAASGDWLTPRLNALDYLEKPPLPYWTGALCYRAFGVSEAAGRLPLALFALLALAAVFWLGAWLFEPRIGLAAAVVLATMGEFQLLSHLQTPDMALTAFLAWASALALRALRRPEDALWAGALAGLASGLAFLSKGLVGLLFPAGWAAALALSHPELRRGFKAAAGPALLAALAIAAPWAWVMEARHPGFSRQFFLEQHFLRYATPLFHRPGGWHYFLGIDALGALPWTPLALAGLVLPLWRRRRGDARLLQLALWPVLILLFYSASRSKLATYLLPVLPQQALLVALLLDRLDAEPAAARWTRLVASALGSIAAAALAAGAAAVWWRGLPAGVPASVAAAAAAGSGALAAGLFLMGEAAGRSASGRSAVAAGGERALLAGALAMAALTGCGLWGARAAGPALSVRDLARVIRAEQRPGDLVLAYGFYPHGIQFYAERPVDLIANWVGELYPHRKDPRFAHRFVDDDTLRGLPIPDRRTFLLLKESEAWWVLKLLAPGRVRRFHRAGGVFLLVV